MLTKKQKRRIEKEVRALLSPHRTKPKEKIPKKDIYACFNADSHKRIYHRPGKYDARFQI